MSSLMVEQSEYAEFWKDVRNLLPTPLSQPGLAAGAEWESTLKDGRAIRISQYILGDAGKDEEVAVANVLEESLMLAQTDSDELVGYRIADFKRGFDRLRVIGYVGTAIGRVGMASALERLNQDYLQATADRLQEPITQIVHNGNQYDLEQLIFDGAPAAEIERKTDEQQRWQRLYGDGGKFGMNDRGRKEFTPRRGRRGPAVTPADPAVLMRRLRDEIMPQLNW